MHRLFRFVPTALVFILGIISPASSQSNAVSELLKIHQFDLAGDGKTFLLNEARKGLFFLLGGIHGDEQTLQLVQSLWPTLQTAGYQYINVEMSPWAASRTGADTLRGTDMEEGQPQMLIRELAALNMDDQTLDSMVEMTKTGYRRSLAPQLLNLLRQGKETKDKPAGGLSLKTLLTRTLEIDVDRLDPKSASSASVRREMFMKELFEMHYRAAVVGESKPKAMLAFGRNHLHRGIDRRGVSTLGNFVAEFAVAQGSSSFNVALFGAGGKVSLGGIQDADERMADPAFALLADAAGYAATVFDLRPLRDPLHKATAVGSLSSSDTSLLYWADSYDAIICYKEITPAK